MDYATRSNLIGALSEEFTGNSDWNIETSNFITDTNAIDCTALGLSGETLEKTKREIERHEKKFAAKNDDPMAAQYLAHMKVAKKCVEEIISQKNKKRGYVKPRVKKI